MNVGKDKKKAPRIVRGAGVVCLRVVPSSGSVGRFDLLGGRHSIKKCPRALPTPGPMGGAHRENTCMIAHHREKRKR